MELYFAQPGFAFWIRFKIRVKCPERMRLIFVHETHCMCVQNRASTFQQSRTQVILVVGYQSHFMRSGRVRGEGL